MDNTKMALMPNLAKAVIKVMQEVEGIDKTMTVGKGDSAYKGVPDKEVKKIIGKSMAKNGLCILPIGVTASTKIERWEETNQYGTKQKSSVFAEATTKYLLLHESGESVELSGYGHGVDSQDKGAGKATTYALKYTLLYTFLVPTGTIDDADNHHSDEASTPPTKPSKIIYTQGHFDKMKLAIEKGDGDAVEKALPLYEISIEFKDELIKLLKQHKK